MGFIVHFIGLMLIVQLQPNGPYHAIIPKWVSGEKFCKQDIMEHAAYIRVETTITNPVVDESKWPGGKDCDPGVKCRLYPITTESTLTIDGGFKPVVTKPPVLPCFVPHLKKEGLVSTGKLHKDALTTQSILDYEIPTDELVSEQFDPNDMIYVKASIVAPAPRPPARPTMKSVARARAEQTRSTPKNIIVTAKPRTSGQPLVLVLKPGTTIDVIDLPKKYAGGPYNVEINDPNMDFHFFFLHKLLDIKTEVPNKDCYLVPAFAPIGCSPNRRSHKGNGTTLNLNCGPGGP
jgi:hypothetical protein